MSCIGEGHDYPLEPELIDGRWFTVCRRCPARLISAAPTIYDGPECEVEGCSEPTVFVQIAAPGTGSGYSCRAGHYTGTCRELTPEEVI